MESRFSSGLLGKVVAYNIDQIKAENKRALGDFGLGGNQGKVKKTK